MHRRRSAPCHQLLQSLDGGVAGKRGLRSGGKIVRGVSMGSVA